MFDPAAFAPAAFSGGPAAQPVPLRDAAYAAILARIEAALADVPAEWDRREELGEEADFPRLVLREGGHRAAPDLAAGEVAYDLEAVVEGYAMAATPRLVSAALNLLHARLVAALVGHEIPVGSAGLAAWVVEDSMERAVLPATESAKPVGVFYCGLRASLSWPLGLGPFTAP